ncbi:hypothetical protein TVAG_113230 [Trichomonas vaginalis G3]|uniref:Calpain catalytic domain-containing protein n=1 Tax=Trichomonas vaginalis (strain ATCC PRA-98 / G3) TaxID=412133 RepID=A2DNH6_TRIV3|nr:cysteine proteinases family [Trichomonas vaginalis G3]EAY17979.1 hypothetical protein TVAG_113230 [Trichomonas vaginalis G3]KAI5499063.1 cysteine proteinases family [Trichomonas vaginalis G3]|eukprot:XP_001578965.1 hypothetical protein [Trichomonas vaginalis G3]
MLNKCLADTCENATNIKNDYCAEIGKHKTAKTKYRDDSFLPNTPYKPVDKPIFSGAVWERAEKIYEQYTNTEIKNSEIHRGLLKDDALIAVLSVMMTENKKIMQWFETPLELTTGIICVKIPFRSQIAHVVVDSKVPKADGKHLLSKPSRGGFPWSAYIEKALAKLLGSFRAVEKLTVKELLYSIFNYTSRTIVSSNLDNRIFEDVSTLIKQNTQAFCIVGNCKDANDVGFNQENVFLVNSITCQNKEYYALLYNPGGKRRFVSTFEERLDRWKGEAKFPKVKDDAFVIRSAAIQKYTQYILLASPTIKSQNESNISTEIKEGELLPEKSFKLKSDKFANISFIVECSESIPHDVIILENDRLKTHIVTGDSIEFFTVRTDPEKQYTLFFMAEKACKINANFNAESAFTVQEENFVNNPLQKIGYGYLTSSKHDGRTPQAPSNIGHIQQWRLKVSEPCKLNFRVINKTYCDAKHFFFIAQTGGEKLRTCGEFFYQEHCIEGNELDGEWSVDITDVSKDYVFGCYRNACSVTTFYDFEIIAEKPIEFTKIPDIEPSMNVASINDKIPNSKNDNRSPVAGNHGLTRLRQWTLNVNEDGKVFVEFEHNDGCQHSVCIQRGSKRMNHFGLEEHWLFASDMKYDVFEFDAKKGLYTVAVIRSYMKASSEFKVNFYSKVDLSIKQAPSLSTEKAHLFSKDVRFETGDGAGFFPMEDQTPPAKQYYLVMPEPQMLIGNIEITNQNPDGLYCVYIEKNGGRKLTTSNPDHLSEHAIVSGQTIKEWFNFDVECDPEVGTVLTFAVTRKGPGKRATISVRFYSQKALAILPATEDLTEEQIAEAIKRAREEEQIISATTSLKRIPNTLSSKDVTIDNSTESQNQTGTQNGTQNAGDKSGQSQANPNGQENQQKSTCCLLL